MGKVTGLGGIFYKVADPARTQAWYKENLGIGGDWGTNFRWADETVCACFRPMVAARAEVAQLTAAKTMAEHDLQGAARADHPGRVDRSGAGLRGNQHRERRGAP